MAVNLVSLVMQFLTPDMTGRIATALGLDRNLVQTAINAAVPGLLAGLGGVAAQPSGAQRLADAAKQQTNSLGNVASALSEGGQTSLIDRGSQLLSSLLGDSAHDKRGQHSKQRTTFALAKPRKLGDRFAERSLVPSAQQRRE